MPAQRVNVSGTVRRGSGFAETRTMCSVQRKLLCIICVIEMIALTGCGYTNTIETSAPPPSAGATTTPQSGATYTQVNSQILQPLCVSCHGSGGQRPDLSSYAGFATSTQYVVPGSPAQSQIYTITQSGQMPPGGPTLTSSQFDLLGSWIQSGAPNN